MATYTDCAVCNRTGVIFSTTPHEAFDRNAFTIEACDECNNFPDDESAMKYVRALALLEGYRRRRREA
jgi:hypothetical protein